MRNPKAFQTRRLLGPQTTANCQGLLLRGWGAGRYKSRLLSLTKWGASLPKYFGVRTPVSFLISSRNTPAPAYSRVSLERPVNLWCFISHWSASKTILCEPLDGGRWILLFSVFHSVEYWNHKCWFIQMEKVSVICCKIPHTYAHWFCQIRNGALHPLHLEITLSGCRCIRMLALSSAPVLVCLSEVLLNG